MQLAVDDFGRGHSGLSYLRRFSIDSLKIDSSFLRQIATVPEEATIASAMIGIGRSLKLRVVAAGVESRADVAFLQAHHCDEGQGSYFSRPVPALAFAALLRAGTPHAFAAAVGIEDDAPRSVERSQSRRQGAGV